MTLYRMMICICLTLGLAFDCFFDMRAVSAAPDQALKDTIYLDTKDGRITIKLRPDLAPKHVAQIEALTKHGFYNGVVFHRVIDGFMAQTGDPTGTGMGKSDLPNIPAEFSSEPFKRGNVGMARSQNPVLHLRWRRAILEQQIYRGRRSRLGNGCR
jgi:peptidylprolyl isomerase